MEYCWQDIQEKLFYVWWSVVNTALALNSLEQKALIQQDT